MKILLTNIWLVDAGGTETWTLTMAKELIRLGHDVTVFTLHIGKFANQFPCEVRGDASGHYDLFLCNHRPCWDQLRNKAGVKVFTSHSYLDDLNEFCAYPDDAVNRVAATEEIQKKRGGVLIHNGIDTELFTSTRPPSEKLKTILYLGSSHNERSFFNVRTACKGYELILSNGRPSSPELINQADLVISYGRGALEAMACARNVVSADCRPYVGERLFGAGMITEQNFDTVKLHNFTGRGDPQTFSDSYNPLEAEFQKYQAQRGYHLRGRIINDYNVRHTARQYLAFVPGYQQEAHHA